MGFCHWELGKFSLHIFCFFYKPDIHLCWLTKLKIKLKKLFEGCLQNKTKKKSRSEILFTSRILKKLFSISLYFFIFFFCVCMYVIALEGWGIKIFIPTPPLVLSNWKKKMFSHYSFMYSHKMVGWMWVVGHLTPKYTLQNCLSLLWVWNSIFSSFFIVHFIVILHVLVFENFFCIQTSIFILTFLHAQ